MAGHLATEFRIKPRYGPVAVAPRGLRDFAVEAERLQLLQSAIEDSRAAQVQAREMAQEAARRLPRVAERDRRR